MRKNKNDEKEYFVEKVVQSENGATGLVVDINNVNIGDEVQLIVDDSLEMLYLKVIVQHILFILH